VLPFGWRCCYFFFFAAFFAGSFLATFLVAIGLFSLLTIFLGSATMIAVEEYIDSCFTRVKEKAKQSKQMSNNFFSVKSNVVGIGSDYVA
jgi:hypothetical protein